MVLWWTKYRDYHNKHPFATAGIPDGASKETRDFHARVLEPALEAQTEEHADFIDHMIAHFS